MTTADPAGRRGGPRPHPTLPLSAFTSPPNTGTLDSFPVPHSPIPLHPEVVLDGNVIAFDGDHTFSQWKAEVGQKLGEKIGGVVLSLPGADLDRAIEQ